MTIEISFDLPFCIRVDGHYIFNSQGESFDLVLTTIQKSKPEFPGAESVTGIEILNDETNILSYTKVNVSYDVANETNVSDQTFYAKKVSDLSVFIANGLISALRIAYDEHHLDYLYSADRIGPITFSVPASGGNKPYSGYFDGLQGGFTFVKPPRTGPQAAPFAQALASGAELTPAAELLFDARRYLLRGNKRMALANLSISFEVGLANKLTEIAAASSDQALPSRIAKATLNKLGTELALKLFGHSFAERSYWTDRFSDAFEWLRTARNGILHKAQLSLTFGGSVRDFSNLPELKALFDERDWLVGEIEKAKVRVIAGQSALP